VDRGPITIDLEKVTNHFPLSAFCRVAIITKKYHNYPGALGIEKAMRCPPTWG
jgi:hypothetical protein